MGKLLYLNRPDGKNHENLDALAVSSTPEDPKEKEITKTIEGISEDTNQRVESLLIGNSYGENFMNNDSGAVNTDQAKVETSETPVVGENSDSKTSSLADNNPEIKSEKTADVSVENTTETKASLDNKNVNVDAGDTAKVEQKVAPAVAANTPELKNNKPATGAVENTAEGKASTEIKTNTDVKNENVDSANSERAKVYENLNKVLKVPVSNDAEMRPLIGISVSFLEKFPEAFDSVKDKKDLSDVDLYKSLFESKLQNLNLSPEDKKKAVSVLATAESQKLRINKLKEALKLKNSPEIKKLNFQSELKSLSENFSYNLDGKIVKPFEDVKISQISNSAEYFKSKSWQKIDATAKYLILHLAIRENPALKGQVEGINEDNLKKAGDLFNTYKRSKSKHEANHEISRNAIFAEVKLLKLKRNSGEIGSFEFFKEYKLLLDKADELKSRGVKGINLSQNAFVSTFSASPSYSYMGNVKDHAKFGIKKKWKTFWETIRLRRGMLLKGAWNVLKFPPRYALKIPAQLLGYRYFVNKIRRKRNLEPLTISGDLHNDFTKFGKGFDNFLNASQKAKENINSQEGMKNFNSRFTPNMTELKATIAKGKLPAIRITQEQLIY